MKSPPVSVVVSHTLFCTPAVASASDWSTGPTPAPAPAPLPFLRVLGGVFGREFTIYSWIVASISPPKMAQSQAMEDIT